MKLKKITRQIIYCIIVAFIFIGILHPTAYGFTTVWSGCIVSKGISIFLQILQVLEFVVPILFVMIKIILNSVKHNGKNKAKNIIIYCLIAIALFLAIVGLGSVIIATAERYGYSSTTIDYINFNGKTVYYHK